MSLPPTLCLRPYYASDRNKIWRLLTVLPKLYPNGNEWLDSRLHDALDGKVRCTVAISQNQILGITIETPKGMKSVKLSTIWVRTNFRRLGVGRALMDRCRSQWLLAGVERAYVTAADKVAPVLYSLLSGYGFRLSGLEANRYGDGRNEAVFSWSSQSISNT